MTKPERYKRYSAEFKREQPLEVIPADGDATTITAKELAMIIVGSCPVSC